MASDPLAPTGANPLDEASPRSLNDLMSASPFNISESDFRAMIEAQRAQRERWKNDALCAKPTRAKKAQPIAPTLDAEDFFQF